MTTYKLSAFPGEAPSVSDRALGANFAREHFNLFLPSSEFWPLATDRRHSECLAGTRTLHRFARDASGAVQQNSNDPTPGASRVKDSTAEPYRWLATFANAVTGGNEWRSGAASPTPEAIEYLVEQITGGVGREANKAVAMATSAFTGEELAPHQVVLAGRLYGNTRGANGQSNAYYENLKRIHISENEFKARVQRGEDVDAVLADVPLAKAHDSAKALDKKISDLRKFRRAVQAGDAPDKRDQVKAINLEIELSMRLLNQASDDVLAKFRMR